MDDFDAMDHDSSAPPKEQPEVDEVDADEPVTVQISISDTLEVKHKKKHVRYLIHVQLFYTHLAAEYRQEWTIDRRYTAFEVLHRELEAEWAATHDLPSSSSSSPAMFIGSAVSKFASVVGAGSNASSSSPSSSSPLPSLPKSNMFRSFEADYVAKKARALEAYLIRLCEMPWVVSSLALGSFLGGVLRERLPSSAWLREQAQAKLALEVAERERTLTEKRHHAAIVQLEAFRARYDELEARMAADAKKAAKQAETSLESGKKGSLQPKLAEAYLTIQAMQRENEALRARNSDLEQQLETLPKQLEGELRAAHDALQEKDAAIEELKNKKRLLVRAVKKYRAAAEAGQVGGDDGEDEG